MNAAQLTILKNAQKGFVVGDDDKLFTPEYEGFGVFQSPDNGEGLSLNGGVSALGGSGEP